MSVSIGTVLNAIALPPLDVLVEQELTAGPVSGAHSFVNVAGYGLVVRFQPIPVAWGYRVGNPNVYIPPLAQVSFSSNNRIYAEETISWGDFLLYPIPLGPFITGVPWQQTNLEVTFAPGISGRVWRLHLPP